MENTKNGKIMPKNGKTKMTTQTEIFKEFEQKFGFECYSEVQKIMASMYQKIQELQGSRDNWKTKYMNLKQSTSNHVCRAGGSPKE